MNLGRILTMIVNRLLRRGIKTAVRKGAGKGQGQGRGLPGHDRAARDAAKRARQAARITRKMR